MNYYSCQIAWSDEDKGYIALSPEWGHLSGFGDTAVEALQELIEAIEMCIKIRDESGAKLPEPLRIN